MKKRALIPLVSMILVLAITFAQLSVFVVTAAVPPDEAERAEALVEVAKKALLRIESLINEAKTTTVNPDLREAEKLYEEGKALLKQAEVAIQEQNYGDAMRLAIRAMERFREVRMGLALILKWTEVEEDKFVKAQGLLMAANRTLERIVRLEKSLSEAQAALETAKSLLNVDKITELLREGNMSEAAHRIAEANKLICQALNSIAKEAMFKRMERFTEKLQEKYEALMYKLQTAGVNVTELLNETGLKNTNEFRESALRLKEAIKAVGPKNAKGLMGQLMLLANGLSKLEKKTESTIATIVVPSKVEGIPALYVGIDAKRVVGDLKFVFLDVVVKNVGDVELQFQNSVYGLTIERKSEDGTWELYYSPISAQVIVFLEPGQTAHVVVKLKQPQPGEYRVRVQGIYEKGKQPLEATVEFTLP
ncbi:MAG: hypothetical protein QXO01_03540 [Nitrososphaerota archaeon]